MDLNKRNQVIGSKYKLYLLKIDLNKRNQVIENKYKLYRERYNSDSEQKHENE